MSAAAGMPWLIPLIQSLIAEDQNVQICSVDGAINITSGIILITKGSAIALTLPLPISGSNASGGDDGNQLRFVPTTSFSHVITTSANGFNGNKHILTLVPPSSGLVVAFGGTWFLVTNNAGTLT